ncbi:hypothetical protein ACQ9BO_08975 [Flavobacterium sp. P21]|uniref:hypothetical protein n=1 Tax=Flavobacterium sp. P21 TaxID=3423948 RepID=UPI003D676A81
MQDVIDKILETHGGFEQWKKFTKVNATIVSGGKLFELINQPQDALPRFLEVYLHEQRLSMTPYGGSNRKTSFTPNRIAIETLDGEVISERTGTIKNLHSHMQMEGWDVLDRAYFNGYANWTYLTTPFFLASTGIKVTEIAPFQYHDEIWTGLRVSFPDTIATHCTIQDFYFDKDYLLRRHDYFIDVAGEFNVTQYLIRLCGGKWY